MARSTPSKGLLGEAPRWQSRQPVSVTGVRTTDTGKPLRSIVFQEQGFARSSAWWTTRIRTQAQSRLSSCAADHLILSSLASSRSSRSVAAWPTS